MKPFTIILIGAALAGLVLFSRKGNAQGNAQGFARDLGNGWKLNADGWSATGPNGEQAMYTGYMTGDIYPPGGYLS